MPSTDRYDGALAAAWPGYREALPGLLRSPGSGLPVPPASDRRRWTDTALDPVTLAALRDRATADLGTPWPVPLPHEYLRYFRDGHRNTYEQTVFARQRRLSRAAVLAAVSSGPNPDPLCPDPLCPDPLCPDPLCPDPLWMDEVVDGVTLLCEQSSWCWPAHDDTFTAHGHVVPTVTDPYVDLGAGEVAGQLAWLDHLLGEALDQYAPGLRERLRHEVDRRVLTPFQSRRDWHWLGLDGDVHNWNPWIHGNILVAALALVSDVDRRAALVGLAVEGIDRYVSALPVDGAIDEGYSYWWNGAGRALEALDVLAHATDGRLTATEVPALRETVAFPHRMHLGGDWYLNLADGQAKPTANQPWHALYRAGQRVGDEAAVAHALAHRGPGVPVAHEEQGFGRLLLALTDRAWWHAEPGQSPLPREVWLPSTQVLLARPAAGSSDGLTLAVKGGHNGEHHNHNDVGSVLVALRGVPVLVDAGRPTYTAQTFGPDRYALWPMQSSWHNVPEIRGTAQGVGTRWAARHVRATVDNESATLTLDLAAAYPRDDVRAWHRTAHLDRAANRVIVTDSWDLAVRPGVQAGTKLTTVHWLVAGTVRVGDGYADIVALDNAGPVRLAWECFADDPPDGSSGADASRRVPRDAPCSVTVKALDDPMLSDVWGDRLTRLEIDVTLGTTLICTVEELR